MRPDREPRRVNRTAPLLALLCAAPLAAQQARELTTPDGSRFVLVPSALTPLVHWVTASPCGPLVDPPDAHGLAAACVHASLRGTFDESVDAAREREVLAELDAAETQLAAARRGAGTAPEDVERRVATLRAEAAALADVGAFRRTLLAVPCETPVVTAGQSHATFGITTLATALDRVADLMVARRERQPLRGVRQDHEAALAKATNAWDAWPLAPLHAEALSLAYAGSPLAQAGERPFGTGATRTAALRTWARTQHPTRAVHVLLGSFDVDAVERTLRRAFATTALPEPPPLAPADPRPLQAIRRSVVPSEEAPACVIAWPLRGDEDRTAVQIASIWLAGSAESWLGRELARRGRPQVQVRSIAPWPEAPGRGMLLVEVVDAQGGDPGLADQVLALCRRELQGTAAPVPDADSLAAANAQLLVKWEHATRSGLAQARTLAADQLLHPGTAPVLQPPAAPGPEQSLRTLQRILAGTPVVVERRKQ